LNDLVQTGHHTTKPKQVGTRKDPKGRKHDHAKNLGREPPHTSPPSTPAHDPPPAETATACTTVAANERQIRLMTNSHKSQSERNRRRKSQRRAHAREGKKKEGGWVF
jgi:hypothetical protein